MLLNCKSWHSLRYGTLRPEELVHEAAELGHEAIGLTDINTVTGIYDFLWACIQRDVKAIVGIEFRRNRSNELCYIGYARNAEGLRELNQFLSFHNIHRRPLPEQAPAFQQAYIVYPWVPRKEKPLRNNEFYGVRPEQIHQLYRLKRRDLHYYLALPSTCFRQEQDHHFHLVLRAIDNNTLFSKVEQFGYARPNEHLLSTDEVLKIYQNYPQLITNNQQFIDDCNFDFDFKSPKNKHTYTGSHYSDKLLLENLAYAGLEERYGKQHTVARSRVEKELAIIDKLHFTAYFLITWDIIRYSKSRGFYHVGRGSGANSIVSYCLGISDVCPLELNLYFERFLNPSRLSPPDFDIDWSWKERDTILDYVFKRFNTEHTAFIGTIGTFKYRSTFRELGKVFGLAKREIDQLTRKPIDQHPADQVVQLIHRYALRLKGFPNMRSLHSCGILISEKPLSYYTALEMPPKGFQTAQFDMYIGERIGFEKLDILSQRGIGHIYDCVQLVKQNQGIEVDIFNINRCKRDVQVNEYLRIGKTLGCFYIESPAMRGLLRRLNCQNYETLVAASSVIRPGVAQSGMLREYVRRHNAPDSFAYPHPVFEEHLGETYGIMVYQEDVLKIAHHFGGLSLADADTLRRAMTGKKASPQRLKAMKQQFFANCAAQGYDPQLAKEVYRQIESFAGYSFCKAHSASYAVESYQSLYLKVYYPLEFCVAVINNFGGFYRTEVYVHEARMAGGQIELPCVNHSILTTTLHGQQIYLGFQHIKGLASRDAEMIVRERQEHGPYKSLEDFLKRLPIGAESVQTLIFVQAFRFTGRSKQHLLIDARMLGKRLHAQQQMALFDSPRTPLHLPRLDSTAIEHAFDELEYLGFMVSYSPFELLKTNFRGPVLVKDFVAQAGRHIRIAGYLLCIKDVPTLKGMMNYGTWIDVAGQLFDSVHFPQQLQAYPFSGAGCYLLYGKIVVEFGYPYLEIKKMAKLPMLDDPRYENSSVSPSFRHLKRGLSHDHQVITRPPHPGQEEVDRLFGREPYE